jgi:hypothetical protein
MAVETEQARHVLPGWGLPSLQEIEQLHPQLRTSIVFPLETLFEIITVSVIEGSSSAPTVGEAAQRAVRRHRSVRVSRRLLTPCAAGCESISMTMVCPAMLASITLALSSSMELISALLSGFLPISL